MGQLAIAETTNGWKLNPRMNGQILEKKTELWCLIRFFFNWYFLEL